MDGSRAVCAEFIRSATIKGNAPDEKVFVEVERRIAKATESELQQSAEIASESLSGNADSHLLTNLQHRVRQRLWRDREEDFGPSSIVETRNIVFMRANSSSRTSPDASDPSSPPPRQLPKPQHTPTYTHTLTPTPQLLFRFSALTFNGHAIHLDPRYAQEIEGHKDLLVHGPLTFVFMSTLLQRHLDSEANNPSKLQQGEGEEEIITNMSYRNLAPLYIGEDITFQGARVGKGKWEVWALKKEGGMAVRGTVKTERRRRR
jgi:hydroxyacyl-ACP dehydratase HTD2-like protein with hotdog domain